MDNGRSLGVCRSTITGFRSGGLVVDNQGPTASRYRRLQSQGEMFVVADRRDHGDLRTEGQ
jgi:hypothetical protein